MAKKSDPLSAAERSARLRKLRLADEAARKQAGTWGELNVGEIVHVPTNSVFVHIWKGPRRPDPMRERAGRPPGIPAVEWQQLIAWVKERNPETLTLRTVAGNVSAAEAKRIVREQVATRAASGFVVTPENAPAP